MEVLVHFRSHTNLFDGNSMVSSESYFDHLHPIMMFHHRYSEYSTMQYLLTKDHSINRVKHHHTKQNRLFSLRHRLSYRHRFTMISISSWRFLHVDDNASEVPNSRYHSLFFILNRIRHKLDRINSQSSIQPATEFFRMFFTH